MSQVAPSLAPQYWALTKPRVVALIVFTAIIGMLLAIQPGDEWPWIRLLAGSVGIWLAAASAAAMERDSNRVFGVFMGMQLRQVRKESGMTRGASRSGCSEWSVRCTHGETFMVRTADRSASSR